MTIETPRQDIASIQMLRGIAALMVVLIHLHLQLERLGVTVAHAGWLGAGVDIFFVISGFIMWVSTENSPNRTAGQFLVNRFVRIVPLYWSLTLIMTVLMLVSPGLFQTAHFEIGHVIKSFLFIPAHHPTAGAYWPVLVPGWTLNYEMFFYLLFGLSIYLSRGSSKVRALCITVFLVSAVMLAQLFGDNLGDAVFYGNDIVLEFLLGIAVGHIYVSRRYGQSYLWWLLLPIGFALLALPIDTKFLPHFVAAGIPATLIVAAAAFATPIRFHALQWLGDISYSLYLTHVVTLSGVYHFWHGLHLEPLGAVVFSLLALAFSILAAGLAYRFVERPLTQWTKAIFDRRRKVEPVSVRPAA